MGGQPRRPGADLRALLAWRKGNLWPIRILGRRKEKPFLEPRRRIWRRHPPNVLAATPVPEVLGEEEEEAPIKVDAPQAGSSAAAAGTAAAELKPEEAPKQSGNTDPPKNPAGESNTKVVKADGTGPPQKRKAQSDAEEKAGAAKAKAKAKADPKPKPQEKASSRKRKT